MTVSAVPPDVVAQATAAAKAWLRMPAGAGDDDAAIAALAASAIAVAEAYCGRVLIARDAEDMMSPNARWQALAAAPVTAIGAVAALAADGTATAIASGGHAIDIDADGTGWVRLTAAVAATRLRVSYTAGTAAAWADVPAGIAQGIVLLVAHLFTADADKGAPPAAVAALWRPWRRLALVESRHA